MYATSYRKLIVILVISDRFRDRTTYSLKHSIIKIGRLLYRPTGDIDAVLSAFGRLLSSSLWFLYCVCCGVLCVVHCPCNACIMAKRYVLPENGLSKWIWLPDGYLVVPSRTPYNPLCFWLHPKYLHCELWPNRFS